MIRPEEIGYTDELLADGTVHRAYEDGLEEWRRRTAGRPHLVSWHDNRGSSGTDELLGDRIIKRVLADGTTGYARDIGYGRTLWGARGEKVLVNRSSFGGRMGVLLTGLGVATLAITAAQLPPLSLSPEQEEALRQQQAQAQQSSGGGGDSGGGDSGGGDDGSGDGNDWDANWDGDEDAWNDDDFG
ncbi:hypothetical protein [Streptomyces sp. NPDC058664]|uniref:hypothetical protein n=1 Tax=unclassified Streptomyces TaxID=2593676 RepID=UPI003656272F